jgi:hypothetical protein
LEQGRRSESPPDLSGGLAYMVHAFRPILLQLANTSISFAFFHYQQRSSPLDPDLFSLVGILKAKAKG